MAKRKDALRIIDRLVGEDPRHRRRVEKERLNASIAQMIHDARTKAGLTQAGLARLVGTRQPVIARLEDADYPGHSLRMLERIAQALNKQLKVELVEN